MATAHPILTCEESLAFEKKLLVSEGAEWLAMSKAGAALGKAIVKDFQEFAPLPESLSVLVLAGKGHNGGDALLAAAEIFTLLPKVEVFVVYASDVSDFRPLTMKAYEGSACFPLQKESLDTLTFDICIDGFVGMQFRPPLRKEMRSVLEIVNEHKAIGLRVAVDLPSGIGDYAFRADFTYATGILKTPLLDPANQDCVGRIRYLNIGLFDAPYQGARSFEEEVLSADILDPFKEMRPSHCDKRSFGHLMIVGGSRTMPGALLMAVKAALRSGVGLVTVFAPESVALQAATSVPEAMWVPWPETPNGGLALEGKHLLLERASEATALLMGPGMGKEPETQMLVKEIVAEVDTPTVLDADALTLEIAETVSMLKEGSAAVIATPHLGEFERMSDMDLKEYDSEGFKWFCHKNNLITVLKGPITRISDGKYTTNSTFGGPVLARGGSGDILSGLLGSLLAQGASDPFTTACMAVVWQGCAADLLAQSHGQMAVQTTQILDYLAPVLRKS